MKHKSLNPEVKTTPVKHKALNSDSQNNTSET